MFLVVSHPLSPRRTMIDEKSSENGAAVPDACIAPVHEYYATGF